MEPDVLIPLFVVGGGLAFIAFVVHNQVRMQVHDRDLLHRERLAAIEAGSTSAAAPDSLLSPPARPRVRNALQDGIGFLIMGIGLVVALGSWRPDLWGWGFFVASIGVANLIYWFLGGRRDWDHQTVLDDEMQRAYIRRLKSGESDGVALPSPPHDGLAH